MSNKKPSSSTSPSSEAGLSLIETMLGVFILSFILTALVVNLNRAILNLLESKYRSYASSLAQTCLDEISFHRSSLSWNSFERLFAPSDTSTSGILPENVCMRPNDGDTWASSDGGVSSPSGDGFTLTFAQTKCATEVDKQTFCFGNNCADGSRLCNSTHSRRIERTFTLSESDVEDMIFTVITSFCVGPEKIQIFQSTINNNNCSNIPYVMRSVVLVQTEVQWSKALSSKIAFNRLSVSRTFVSNN